jgi:protein O-mannosyl-transferase
VRRVSPDLWICAGLLAAILVAYLRVCNFDFVSLDDQVYVLNNPHVRSGLTAGAALWAFKFAYAGYWFPLTLVSYMMDWQIYGASAGGYHLTNVLLHGASTLLLYGVLCRMTGTRWRSAFVAFVFGLHPLHVEAVAWIAERKEVLSGFFWMLTLWAYLRYVKRPSLAKYFLVLLGLCCGLMSKPMIVTLPIALLLLDYWPLGRFGRVPARRLILEKIPLFAVCAAGALAAVLTQENGQAVSSLGQIPAHIRIENALESYVFYVWKFFLPQNLAVIYPYSLQIPLWQAIAAGLTLMLLTWLAIRAWERQPYLGVGWLWFLVTLAPVIGLVQAGLQARADRYTYIPFVGISIALGWWMTEEFERRKWPATVLAAGSILFCGAWEIVTWTNVGYWQNSVTLFQHAIEATENNWVALSALGQALVSDGRTEEAIPYLREAVRVQPNFPDSHIYLASADSNLGKFDDAETEFREALNLEPENADAQEGLGMVLTEKHQNQEALVHLKQAIAIRPDDANSHYNLGRLYALSGRTDQAIAEFRATIRLRPDHAEAEYNLGTALAAGQQFAEARLHFENALRLKPDYTAARFNLGGTLASMGLYDQAVPQFEEVLRAWPGNEQAQTALEECLRRGSKK